MRRRCECEKAISRVPSRITATRVMTDNGSCYVAKEFAKACKALGLKHIRTRHYTLKTDGKAERFIQTALRGRGVCTGISIVREPETTSAELDPHVQLPSPSRRAKIKNANQSPRPDPRKPVEVPHSAKSSGNSVGALIIAAGSRGQERDKADALRTHSGMRCLTKSKGETRSSAD